MALGFRMGGAGGTTERKVYLSPIDTLLYTQPSNTTYANSTKRTWTKDSYCRGISSGNYYQPSVISNFSISGNTLTMRSSTVGFGVEFILKNTVPGETYRIDTGITNGGVGVIFYQADGTYMTYTSASTNEFTVPNNCEYVVLNFVCATVNQNMTAVIRGVSKVA